MRRIKIPDDVKYIIDTLEADGFEAYAVGGCVRDSLLGMCPNDWDICTLALPDQTKGCFAGGHIIETGLKHGTITLVLGHTPYEITTYRTDGKYTDNRRPDKVRFVNVLKRDLARRDFTINALAYNPKTGLTDYYGGLTDLREGRIKCVGNAGKRFREDALRIMRALRFASVFGFAIETDTAKAMRENKKLLCNISAERIAAELNKLLTGGGVRDILSEYTEIITEIIPEFKREALSRTLRGVECAPKDTVIRLAVFLRGFGAETAEKILKRLKYDKKTIKTVALLVCCHDFEIINSGTYIKRWLNKIGAEKFRQLLEVKKAVIMAEAQEFGEDRSDALKKLIESLDEIIEQKQCFSLENLAVNGRDLIDAGVPEGAEIGEILKKLLDMVIDDKAKNDKAVLLEIVK